MNTEQLVQEDGRVAGGVRERRLKRYTAQERTEILHAYDASDEAQNDFCAVRGINLGTFKGWLSKRAKRPGMGFAQVEIPVTMPAPVEIILRSGVRVGIRHQGSSEELIALIRGVAGC